MKKNCLIFGTSVMIGATSSVQAVELKLKWEAGKTYLQATKQKMSMTMPDPRGGDQVMKMENNMDMDTNLIAKEHAKGTEVTMDITRVKMSVGMAGNMMMDYDSEKGDQAGPLSAAFKPMLENDLVAVFDGDGKLLEFKGADKIKGLDQAGIDADTMKNMMTQTSQMLPNKDVNVGESWSTNIELPMGKMAAGPIKLKLDCKLESYEGDMAKVSFSGKLDAKLGEEGKSINFKADKFDGNYTFDTKIGQIVDTTTNMNFAMTVQEAGGMAMTGSSVSTQTLTIK